MTTPVWPAKRPSRGWYAVAAVLAALAVAIGTVLAVWIIRALLGYEVTPFPEGEPVTIVLEDRGEAIWVSPDSVAATCEVTGGQGSFGRGSAERVTFFDRGRNWVRVGIVNGASGSEQTVICRDQGTTQVFGHAPNPRIGPYVVVGLLGGGIAGICAVAAFVIVLVVAIKRNRKPTHF